MNIGLYFGTFNPVHVGHLIIANYMANYTNLERVWLVVTPKNPLKAKDTLLADYHRLATVRIAVEENSKLDASNVEFDLPKPSYTIDSLTYLKEKYPQHNFSLIMGEDNLRTFYKWKNYMEILENHQILVYPRLLTQEEQNKTKNNSTHDVFMKHTNIKLHNAPVMNISSSFIRKAIKENKDVQYLLSEPVYKYVSEMHFYKK